MSVHKTENHGFFFPNTCVSTVNQRYGTAMYKILYIIIYNM